MHLPKPIYQYAPHYWVVVGILLVLLGLDSDPGSMFRYFSVTLGVLSTVWGAMIFMRRRGPRQVKDSQSSA